VRKLIIAAATVAALGTLGLGATAAQAQPASPSMAKTTTSNKTVVAGIAASTTVTFGTTGTCTKVTVTGLPSSVSAGTSSTVKKGCEVEVEGVFPTPGKHVATFKFTVGGTTTTVKETFTVLASPCENDAVGVGSDTITPLTDQLASDYNNTLASRTTCSGGSTTKPFEYSWDATNPITGAIGDSIAEKADCSHIARPDGSSAGITQLATFTKSSSGPFCTNFARSSRSRATTDPPFAAGGVAFVAMAGDAVSWSVPSANTSAPKSLTTAQLQGIFTCSITNWNQVGGANQAISAFLPQSGSGTLSFWETELGVTPGPCVSNDNNLLEENEGVNPVLNTPGTIFIYSVGDYIAQKFHADSCLNSACTPVNSKTCKKTPNKIQFWCDVHGTMTPGQINGVAPTTGSGTGTKINPAFSFQRTLFDVVPFDPNTTDHIPGSESGTPGGLNLEGIFGASGFYCSSATAKADITAYGFENIANCGTTS
jgi:ABC-type phosphate transport system substrate-binding protein